MIVFLESNCGLYTGYRYICDSIKGLPIGEKVKVLKSAFSVVLGARSLFFVLLIAALILPVSSAFRVFFKRKCLMLVSSLNNPAALLILGFNSVAFYMVDSLYDYYWKRLKGCSNFIRIPVLVLAYLSEIAGILLASEGIYLNSRIACRAFNRRYRYLWRILKKKPCEFLPIGYSQDIKSRAAIKNQQAGAVIGIYGNFHFFENRESLEAIFNAIGENPFVEQIRLAGPGFDTRDSTAIVSRFPKVHIDGVVLSIKKWKQTCDGLIIQASSTNGVKVKFLECLADNIPFYATSSVVRHLASPKNLNASHLFVGRDFDDLSEFISFVLARRSGIDSLMPTKVYSWEPFLTAYNKVVHINQARF